jgi:sugar phosphate isomerase/epimerase
MTTAHPKAEAKALVGISAHAPKPDLSNLAANIAECVALGVDTVELPTYDFDIVVGGRIRRDQLAAAKAACAGHGVAYSAHGPLSINLMDDAYRLPRHVEVLLASLDVAAELGCVNYVMHGGIVPATQAAGVEDAYQRQRDHLARAGDEAQRRGLIICVETLFAGYHGSSLTATPARLARELAAINHPAIRSTIDFSHGAINLDYHGGDLATECAPLAPFAKHLHIHDSFGRQDDIWMYSAGERLAYGHGDLHLPVGWGNTPWNAILDACIFPAGVIFNIELNQRYWHLAQDCVAATRIMANRAKLS